MTEEMMTQTDEQARDTRWRKAVEYMLNDNDVILSSMAPLGVSKTTWKQVKALAEQWSEEKP